MAFLKFGVVFSFAPEAEVLIRELISALTDQPEPDDGSIAKGTIVARYKFNEDQDDVTYDLIFRGGQTRRGTSVGAGDVDLTAESNNAGLMASIENQTLSEDGNEVKATVRLSGGQMPNADLAVVTYKATNRDNGNVLAADSDEFEIGPGEVVIGTLDSPVPLEEVVSAPPEGGGEPPV